MENKPKNPTQRKQRSKKTTQDPLDNPSEVQYYLSQVDTKECIAQLYNEGRIEYNPYDY